MSIYHELAQAKIELRQAKDHFETVKAIVEMGVVTTGKNAEDRKRELTVALAQDEAYQAALGNLRGCEGDLDRVQAIIEQDEAERRDHEWSIRARLAEALGRLGLDTEDQIPDWLQDRRAQHRAVGLTQAQREMDDLFTK